MPEAWKKAPCDRAAALLLGGAIAAVAYWLSPKTIDCRAWQPICEGALLRPPEFFLPGLFRLVVYVLTRVFGIGPMVRMLMVAGPVALGVVAYQSVMLAMTMSAAALRLQAPGRTFRHVMMPLLTAAGMGLFLTSGPVLRAAWGMTPSLLALTLTFTVAGAFRVFFTRGNVSAGHWGMFGAGVLSAECALGVILALVALGLCLRAVHGGDDGRALSRVKVYHVAKWGLSVMYLLGAGTMLAANAWFFNAHGGEWLEGLRGSTYLADFKTLGCLFGAGGALFAVAWALVVRSSDRERYLPYANGLLLMLLTLAAIVFCKAPDVVAVGDECARMVLLSAAAFVAVVSLQALLGDVYCRVQTHYPRFVRRVLFRLVVAILLTVSAADVALDGTRAVARAVDRAADEVIAESAGMKRLFSDGAMDGLVEIKSALAGGRLLVHSMLGGRGGYAERLRGRDALGNEDMSMMRIGASVALGSWVRTGSPELTSSAVQLGLELWKRQDKPFPPAGGLVVLPEGTQEALCARARAWADAFVDWVLTEDFQKACARCREKRWREVSDMILWRLGRLLELRATEHEKRGEGAVAARLREKVSILGRQNASLNRLRNILSLPWHPDTLQLTPREALKVALGRSDFRAARPHAEVVLSSNPKDASANFALGMYHYGQRDLERADGCLSAAHDARPADPAILNNLAVVRMCRGNLTSAEELARKALGLNPNDGKVRATWNEIQRRIKSQPSRPSARSSDN